MENRDQRVERLEYAISLLGDWLDEIREEITQVQTDIVDTDLRDEIPLLLFGLVEWIRRRLHGVGIPVDIQRGGQFRNIGAVADGQSQGEVERELGVEDDLEDGKAGVTQFGERDHVRRRIVGDQARLIPTGQDVLIRGASLEFEDVKSAAFRTVGIEKDRDVFTLVVLDGFVRAIDQDLARQSGSGRTIDP